MTVQTHHLLLLEARLNQEVCEPIGLLIQLAVADLLVLVEDSRTIWTLHGLILSAPLRLALTPYCLRLYHWPQVQQQAHVQQSYNTSIIYLLVKQAVDGART